MLPVIATTIFGHYPAPEQLVLLRQFGFLQLQADLDLFSSQTPAHRLKAEAAGAGVSIVAAHLPRERASAETAASSLDAAYELGARVAIAHSPADPESIAAWCDAGSERGVVIAFEIEAEKSASAESLADALKTLGPEHGRHGLCLDTSRHQPSPEAFEQLRPHLRWLEVSDRRGEHLHRPPSLDDLALRKLVAGLNMPYVCYEVVPVGIPGDALLLSMLSDISRWHRGGGTTNYEHFVSP